MSKLMKFTSKRGREIYFDNWEDETENEDLGGYWVDMCPHHHNMYKGILKGRIDNGGSGVACCSVYGCDREDAGYYADFKKDEVKMVKVERRFRV